MNLISPRLARVLKTVEAWPADQQDAAAELLERMHMLATTPYKLTEEERADIEDALAEAERGEFATDAEVAAMYKRHGL
jgi:predicted transcriptional regulator